MAPDRDPDRDAQVPLLGNAIALTDRRVPRTTPATSVRDGVDALLGRDYATVATVAVLE